MAIPDDTRSKLIRLGVYEGSIIDAEKIGSVVVTGNTCIGRNLAKRIVVEEAQ